jgi:hypothetical protein
VKVEKKCVDVWTHIQSVKAVSLSFLEKRGISVERSEWTYLNITPILPGRLALQNPKQVMQVSRLSY